MTFEILLEISLKKVYRAVGSCILNVLHSLNIFLLKKKKSKQYWDILCLVTSFFFSKILGPLGENEFQTEDFSLLERIPYSTSAEKIKAVVKEMGVNTKR